MNKLFLDKDDATKLEKLFKNEYDSALIETALLGEFKVTESLKEMSAWNKTWAAYKETRSGSQEERSLMRELIQLASTEEDIVEIIEKAVPAGEEKLLLIRRAAKILGATEGSDR